MKPQFLDSTFEKQVPAIYIVKSWVYQDKKPRANYWYENCLHIWDKETASELYEAELKKLKFEQSMGKNLVANIQLLECHPAKGVISGSIIKHLTF